MDPLNVQNQVMQDLDQIESSMKSTSGESVTESVANDIFESYQDLNSVLRQAASLPEGFSTVAERLKTVNDKVKGFCEQHVLNSEIKKQLKRETDNLDFQQTVIAGKLALEGSSDDDSDIFADFKEEIEKPVVEKGAVEKNPTPISSDDDSDVDLEVFMGKEPAKEEPKGFWNTLTSYFTGS